MPRPVQVIRLHAIPGIGFRRYHSYDHPTPPRPFSASETAILAASLVHVPKHGFTNTSLALGAKDAGYLDVSTNLFPKRAFSLVHYHLATQRVSLRKHSQALQSCEDGKALGIGAKVKALTWARLLSNEPIIHRWQEALALMALPGNIPTSLGELASLSDEIWFLSGDTSVDTSWYTKRASLSAIYAASDLFMTTDKSVGFQHTQHFLHRRFEDSFEMGSTVKSLGDWMGFTAGASINILRSKGLKI